MMMENDVKELHNILPTIFVLSVKPADYNKKLINLTKNKEDVLLTNNNGHELHLVSSTS